MMDISELFQDQPERLSQEHPQSIFTAEALLYLALGLMGACVRCFLLDYAPLNALEAQQAVASWNFLNGSANAFTGSPLLFAGNTLMFALFGATDVAARILPALFGSLLILLPAFFRRELGRSGALIASTLLALSPSLVLFSRTADGAIIAVTCALVALGFAWRYFNDHAARALNLAAIFAALAVLSASQVWTILFALIIFALAFRGWLKSFDVAPNARNEVRFAGVLFALMFVGVGTLALTHREGLGAAFDLFGAWLFGLAPTFAIFDPVRSLVIYEPLILFFGAGALVQLAFRAATDEHNYIPLAAFALWGAIALFLYSIGGDKNPARIIVIVVPLALLTGWFIGTWLDRMWATFDRVSFLTQELPIIILGVVVAAFLFIIFAELATRNTVAAADLLANAMGLRNASAFIILSLVTVAIGAVAILALTSVGVARAGNLGLMIVLILLSAWTFRQTMLVNFPDGGALNPRELLVVRAAAPNLRDFLDDLNDVSRWRANDAFTLNVAVDEKLRPMLAWYLRDFRNAQFVVKPTLNGNVQAVVLTADAPAPASGGMSQTYQLEFTRREEPQNFLRWLIFRDTGAIANTSASLWMPPPISP